MSSQRLSQLSTPRRRGPTPLAIGDAVLCVLCDALNHRSNPECWVCRWHGAFNRDGRAVLLAWRRLEGLYEEVRLEHVTSSKRRLLGDLGLERRPRGWGAILACLRRNIRSI